MNEIKTPILSHGQVISKISILKLICIFSLFFCHGFLLLFALSDLFSEYHNLRSHIFLSKSQSDGSCPSKFFSFSCCMQPEPQPYSFSFGQNTDYAHSLKDTSRWMTQISVSKVGVVSGISDYVPCRLPMIVTPIDILPRFRLKVDFQCSDRRCQLSPCSTVLSSFVWGYHEQYQDQTVSFEGGRFSYEHQSPNSELSLEISVASVLTAIAVNLHSLPLSKLIEDINDVEREWLLSAILSEGLIDLDTALSVFSFYDGRYPSMQNIYCFYDKRDNNHSCFLRLGNILVYPVAATALENHSPFLLSECVLSLLDTLHTDENPTCDLDSLNIGFVFFPRENDKNELFKSAALDKSEQIAEHYYDEPEYFFGGEYYSYYFHNDDEVNYGDNILDCHNLSSFCPESDSTNARQHQDEKENSSEFDYSYYYPNMWDISYWYDESLEDQSSHDPNHFSMYSNLKQQYPMGEIGEMADKPHLFQSPWMYDDHGGARYSGDVVRHKLDNGKIFNLSKMMNEKEDTDDMVFNLHWQSLPWIFAKATLEHDANHDDKDDEQEWVDDEIANTMFQDLFAQLCPTVTMNSSIENLSNTKTESNCAMITMTFEVNEHRTNLDSSAANAFNHKTHSGFSLLDQSDYQSKLDTDEMFLCQVSVWEAAKQAWITSATVETCLLLYGLLGNFLVSFALLLQLWQKRNRESTHESASPSEATIVSAIAVTV